MAKKQHGMEHIEGLKNINIDSQNKRYNIRINTKKASPGKYSIIFVFEHLENRESLSPRLYLIDKKNSAGANAKVLEKARDQRELMENEFLSDADNFTFSKHRKEDLEFFHFAEKEMEDLGEGTLAIKKKVLKKFRQHETRDKLPMKLMVNVKYLRKYYKFLLKQKTLSISTVNLYYKVIISFLNAAAEDGLIDKPPLIKKEKSARKPIVFLSGGELQKLVNTPYHQQYIRLLFLLGCFTGLRYSDMMKMQWTNIKKNEIHFTVQKTDKVLHIAINKNIRAVISDLKELGSESKYLFKEDVYQSRHSGILELRRWATLAGVDKDIYWHSGRHTFVTQLVEQGVQLEVIAKLVGHASTRMTETYAHLLPEQAKAIMLNVYPEFKAEKQPLKIAGGA